MATTNNTNRNETPGAKALREAIEPELLAAGFTWSDATSEWVHADGRRGRICQNPTGTRTWLASPRFETLLEVVR